MYKPTILCVNMQITILIGEKKHADLIVRVVMCIIKFYYIGCIVNVSHIHNFQTKSQFKNR